MTSCCEDVTNAIDQGIARFFARVGRFVGARPLQTVGLSVLLAVVMGGGFATWETENRPEKLWVPQDTTAETEEEMFLSYYPRTSRFNNVLVQDAEENANVLSRENLEAAVRMHTRIATTISTVDSEDYDLVKLCTRSGGSCVDETASELCGKCFLTSILRMWNYDLATLQNDTDIMATLQMYGTREDLEAVLGNAVFDENGSLVSAEAFTLSYFLQDRSVFVNGANEDPINLEWEQVAFLDTMEAVPTDFPTLSVDYFSSRSFEDEFGEAITGDLALVQISYIASFLFLGANLGRVKCGPGSRWLMSLGALFMIALSTIAGFGLSSLLGLFYGPVHSVLPFVLLGIGVDDAFVIVNAFDRERRVRREDESDEELVERSSRGLARAGASITVTSLTDLVAFAISSSSALPALSSFCAYASICIFFLWVFASTFFTACLVLDERRHRARRMDCFCCCLKRKENPDEDDGDLDEEGVISTYFRKYHAPTILSWPGKVVVLVFFSFLLSYGFYGATQLSVEDTERNFIPPGSYIGDYVDASDEYFPSNSGIDLSIVFEDGQSIYDTRQDLHELDDRLDGLSTAAPYIAEPVSDDAYRNVMTGLGDYLAVAGSGAIGNATLGTDGWPTTTEDFYMTIKAFVSFSGPGARYNQDVSFSDTDEVRAIRVQAEYVRLTKDKRGEQIDDADRQIDAMDETRDMVASWTDLPTAFTYSIKFLAIEGFKIIRKELFQNVGLAILAVGLIVLATVAHPVTSMIITLNVAFCIVEILGMMYAIGTVIDSVSVINIVLAVGLSVDYSAHVGHCFMAKGGDCKDDRMTESLADIGAAVLSGALSTFLAVAVLLFSSSYVFVILSSQFALTVGLGVLHGLVLLPVLLSLFGPEPFASAEKPHDTADEEIAVEEEKPVQEKTLEPEDFAEVEPVKPDLEIEL